MLKPVILSSAVLGLLCAPMLSADQATTLTTEAAAAALPTAPMAADEPLAETTAAIQATAEAAEDLAQELPSGAAEMSTGLPDWVIEQRARMAAPVAPELRRFNAPAAPQAPALEPPVRPTPPTWTEEARASAQGMSGRMIQAPVRPEPPARPTLDGPGAAGLHALQAPPRPPAPDWLAQRRATQAPPAEMTPPLAAAPEAPTPMLRAETGPALPQFHRPYTGWGAAPGGWGPVPGGWGGVPGGWGGNNWTPWGGGWGNNSWMPWGNNWGGNNWGGNNWSPWNSGWGNNWTPWNSGSGGHGWNQGYTQGDGWGNTYGDAYGDGQGEADFSFAMRAWASGDLRGRGDARGYGDGLGRGYGYQGHPAFHPPVPSLASAPAQQPAPAADSDGDGVADTLDLCPGTAPDTRVDAFGCDAEARIVLRGVNFKTDSDELTDESLAILDAVSTTLVANPEIRVMVAGHTDSDGEAEYNKDLSQRRAQAVVDYLAVQGVERNNMIARGYGEEQPIASNDDADGKAQNRRVELNRL